VAVLLFVASPWVTKFLIGCLLVLVLILLAFSEKQKARTKEVQKLLSAEIASLKAQIANLKRKR
jgi:hypothetical protein